MYFFAASRSRQPESLPVIPHGLIVVQQPSKETISEQKSAPVAATTGSSNVSGIVADCPFKHAAATLDNRTANRPASASNDKPSQSSSKQNRKQPAVLVKGLAESATLERPPKVFVTRSVEMMHEKGISGNITGRNRQVLGSPDSQSHQNHLEHPGTTETLTKTAQNKVPLDETGDLEKVCIDNTFK